MRWVPEDLPLIFNLSSHAYARARAIADVLRQFVLSALSVSHGLGLDVQNRTLLTACEHLLRQSSCLDLGLHLLQSRAECFNLLLQAFDGHGLLLYRLMLFEKLIEQHRIRRVVAQSR